MTFEIYAIGDALYLSRVLNAIAAFANGAHLAKLGAIGAMLGLLVASVRGVLTAGRDFGFHQILVGIILFMVLFGTRATVVIDPLNPLPGQGPEENAGYRIDNVPWGAAAAGSFISLVGYKLTMMFEHGYGTVEGNGVTLGGYGRTLELVNAVRALEAPVLANAPEQYDWYRDSLVRYIHDCTLRGLNMGHVSKQDLFSSADPLQGITYDSQWQTTQSSWPDGTQRDVTCVDAMARLRAGKGELTTMLEPALAKVTGSPNAIGDITAAFASLGSSAAESMQDYMMGALINAVWIDAMKSGPMSSQDVAASIMIQQGSEQRATQWAAEETLYRRIMRPMIGFFEGLVFAVVPFMAFLVGFGQAGINLLTKYAMLTLWVQLWMPVLAIVNLYQTTQVEHFVRVLEAAGSTPATSVLGVAELQQQAVDWLSTGGMIAASTPAIALMLLYGGAVTATHLAGRLQGGDHVNEKTLTPDALQTGPIMEARSMLSHDRVGGTRMTGGDSAMVEYSTGNAFGMAQSSARAVEEARNLQVARGLSESLKESGGISQSGSESLARAFRTASSSDQSALVDAARSAGVDLSERMTTGRSDKDSISTIIGGALGLSVGSGKGGQANAAANAHQGSTSEYTRANDAGLSESESAKLQSSTKFQAALGRILSSDAATSYSDSALYQLAGDRASSLQRTAQESVAAKETYQQVASANSALGSNFTMTEGQWSSKAVADGAVESLLVQAMRLDSAAYRENLEDVSRLFPAGDQHTAAAALRTLGGYNSTTSASAAAEAEKARAFASAIADLSGARGAIDIAGSLGSGGSEAFAALGGGVHEQRSIHQATSGLRPPEGSASGVIGAARGAIGLHEASARLGPDAVGADYTRNELGLSDRAVDARSWVDDEGREQRAEFGRADSDRALERNELGITPFLDGALESANSVFAPAATVFNGALHGEDAVEVGLRRAQELGMRGELAEVAAMADLGPLVAAGNAAFNPAAADAFESAKTRLGEVTGDPHFAERVVHMVRTGETESPEFRMLVEHYNAMSESQPREAAITPPGG
jgi:conjugal transfer mating pair stabilization protein TraG